MTRPRSDPGGISSNQFTRVRLVWAPGMPTWDPAQLIAEGGLGDGAEAELVEVEVLSPLLVADRHRDEIHDCLRYRVSPITYHLSYGTATS